LEEGIVRKREPLWIRGLSGKARKHKKKLRHAYSIKRHLAARRRHPNSQQVDFLHVKQYRVNKKLRKNTPDQQPAHHRFPKVLDLVNNFEETFSSYKRLKDNILYNPSRQVFLDHSEVERISPDAALVLIAEMTRAHEYVPRCTKRGNLPKNNEVLGLLSTVGYLGHFGVRSISSDLGTREYLKYVTSWKTKSNIADEVVDHFSSACNFTVDSQKALKVAIVECMGNVKRHAYPDKKNSRKLIDQWWLIAYRDRTTHEVYFCFYDQGSGIPDTIRTRPQDRIPFIQPSDSHLISKGMEGHYSSTRDEARGSGLPTLREFVETAVAGNLLILSGHGKYSYNKKDGPVSLELKKKFTGTLVVWSMVN